ncbi:unnamed protein product [Leptidea sinapis]|uniref:DDE-1 domain-containing protein n=1 Tax=Leptidea sinapis TaxID=189913 RepID=A0A5E4QT68_9NEOP|nr:unnamed protein product [Leptidea sinapis]
MYSSCIQVVGCNNIFSQNGCVTIGSIKPIKDDPVLLETLVLDGHVTYTKNLEAIELARANGVIMLCLPPHCTHRLQPMLVLSGL